VHGALMVCGTGSDVGKSHVVTGLCRALHRRGVKVAPFKAQNMALNSYVTLEGHEIGRAQASQAFAAGIEPDVAMNPILLKPSGATGSQVIVRGRAIGHLEAGEYHDRKPELLATVLEALADLRARFDVVVLEGAGSPAEINLVDRDIVNLPIAVAARIKAILVGDIDRGGVFAALHGTLALLPDDQRACVGGFVINKLRGDPALLFEGPAQLEELTGVPTLGVLPWVDDVALDAEDSLALLGPRPRPTVHVPTVVDVAVVRFPHLANATDLDPLAIEPGVGLRWVDHAAALGSPDLVVLPGTKSTVADLGWLRSSGLAAALEASSAAVVGVCGGYQMLGRTITDPTGVESPAGTTADGLGWLAVDTVLEPGKVTRRRRGTADGHAVEGYEIHHGRMERAATASPWLCLEPDGEPEGVVGDGARRVLGTSLHGLFEADGFRSAFLGTLGRPPCATSFATAREAQLDRLGDLIEGHLDLCAIERLIEERP
jgi:adenosylcobyric acid synthase